MKIDLRNLVYRLLAVLILASTYAHAESGVQLWAQRYQGTTNGGEAARAIVADSSNNIVVAGLTLNGVSATSYDIIKYSGAGDAVWTNHYSPTGLNRDKPLKLAVDGNDNVILAGTWKRTPSYFDFAIAKYSSAGMLLWTNAYSSVTNTAYSYAASSVVVDWSNNVVAAGYSASAAFVTIKYSEAGQILWTNLYDAPAYGNYPPVLAVDANNNVIVAGTSVGTYDFITIKYSSAGVPQWTNRYAAALDFVIGLVVDGNNDVIVTGKSGNAVATVKYSEAGVPLWTNLYQGYIYSSMPTAIAVDSANNVVVTGNSTSAGADTLKYSPAGVPLWTNRFKTDASYARETALLAIDQHDNVIIAGYASKPANFTNYVALKYSSAGLPIWTNFYSGVGTPSNLATAMTVDHEGNVIVTGDSRGGTNWDDMATIKLVCVPEPSFGSPQRTSDGLKMRVGDLLPHGTLIIQASTNFVDWSPVFTNTATTNALYFTDPAATNAPGRYYRALQFP